MGRGGKVVYKRGGGSAGGGSWRWGRRARGGSRSEDASDEEYVVGEDDEADGESSDDSYSSDASREASQGASSSGEDEEEKECDWLEEEEEEEGEVARRGRLPRRKPAAKLLRRRKASVALEDGEMEGALVEKPRARPRRSLQILAEGEEDGNEDDDDEDFSPDEDEEEEEEPARVAVGKNRSVKRQGRRRAPGNPKVKEKMEKAIVKKRRRRADPSSDDDDFVGKDWVSVEDDESKSNREVSSVRKRRTLIPTSDPSDPDSSDVDYTVSDEELTDPQVGWPSIHRKRVDLSGGMQKGEKGKGKKIDDLGKQVCGICLSEEHNMVVRGMLDCCAHYFCFACIMEWSKVESRCPLCKRRFHTVSKSARMDAGFGLRTAIVRVPNRDQVYQPSEEEIMGYLDPYANVVCIECQQEVDDNLMLLCDICDSSAHTYCVGLGREVPEGNWYCDGCRSVDHGSSNYIIPESAVGHGASNSGMLQEEYPGGVGSENVAVCMSLASPQQRSSLLSQPPPSEGSGQGTSVRCQTAAGDQGTASRLSGFAASTVSGRRSIHQRIRIILSNNRVRCIPEIASTDMMQSSSLESYHGSSEIQQNWDMHCVPEECVINGVNERNNMPLGPRLSLRRCTHSVDSSCDLVKGAKKQVKSTVKKHLSYLARESSLGHRDLKEIARHATHTILAACGFQHRQNMVTMAPRLPSNCLHLADGESASVMKGCCSSCFSSFVGNVVREILDPKLRSR